jgi:hypothetical protein
MTRPTSLRTEAPEPGVRSEGEGHGQKGLDDRRGRRRRRRDRRIGTGGGRHHRTVRLRGDEFGAERVRKLVAGFDAEQQPDAGEGDLTGTSGSGQPSVTSAEAVEIARVELGMGADALVLEEIDLELEDGRQIWDVEFAGDHEVEVDSTTGEVVKVEVGDGRDDHRDDRGDDGDDNDGDDNGGHGRGSDDGPDHD